MSYRYLPCITSTGHFPTAKATISLVLYPYLPVHPLYHKVLQRPTLYHKTWTLSYWYIPYITRTCPTDKTLSYSYLSHITSTGPCPTVTALISQLLVLALPVHPLYHEYWTLSYSYLSYITSTTRSLATLQPLLHRQCVDHKVGASDPVRKAPISLKCDNWRLGRDYFATKINDVL